MVVASTIFWTYKVLKLSYRILEGYHSISFPLISAGIYGGALDNPAAESAKQCCRAYKRFIEDYPTYPVDVKLCAFSAKEMAEAQKVFDVFFG